MTEDAKLSRSDKPERKFIENPFTWWKGTSLGWNRSVTIWNGTGEMEALCELFFDNLATFLGVTGATLSLSGIAGGAVNGAGAPVGYSDAMAAEWQSIYFNRNIPGCAFALLFGNAFYAWQAGRLGAKEGRTDVTAQPYGMNTTGIFITIFAINLQALINGGLKYMSQATDGDVAGAAKNAAVYAWEVSVSANFLMGLFEMFGAVIGEAIRKVVPTAAFYSPLVGVGFVWLAFAPMLNVAAEPIMCLVPLLIVMVGFFGGVKYGGAKFSLPIALMAILWATISAWAGACKRKVGTTGHAAFGYTLPYYDDADYVTCQGSSRTAMEMAWDTYAGSSDIMKDSVFVGLAGFDEIGDFISTIFLVAMVGFTATMACVESASAAGDDYPMAETMLADGAGTCVGALFGGFFSTTVYIGHPVHKALGAKRGYSLINGFLYFILLLSGIFPWLYNMIPECANGAILLFVGLLLGRQAFEETKPAHYPALLLCTFPYICNWARLDMSNEGIQMMGQAGGLLFSFGITWVFCVCIDRDFIAATAVSFALIPLSLFGFFASHNKAHGSPPWEGDQMVGFYGKEEHHDYNAGWRWAIGWAQATLFFAVHVGLQKAGVLKGKVSDEAPVKDAGIESVLDAAAPEPATPVEGI